MVFSVVIKVEFNLDSDWVFEFWVDGNFLKMVFNLSLIFVMLGL